MLNMLKNSLSAGMLISIVSYCNLVCGNKYIGAILFAFGLVVICRYSMSLFTGMAGYINGSNLKPFFTAVAVNCISAFLFGMLASLNPAARESAAAICEAKTSNSLLWLFVSSIFCGILIYVGVDIYKKSGSFIGIIFAIPIFVLCGFDHTVADLFYYGAAASFKAEHIVILPIIIAGNVLGSNIVRFLIVPPAKQGDKPKTE